MSSTNFWRFFSFVLQVFCGKKKSPHFMLNDNSNSSQALQSLASILAHLYLKLYKRAKTTAYWLNRGSITYYIFNDSLLEPTWTVLVCVKISKTPTYSFSKRTLNATSSINLIIFHRTVRALHLTATQILSVMLRANSCE